jgi:pimeloyl-ACP methyl ester carboxylesterase
MSRATVVYVHGLWMTGSESLLLRRRLGRERGFCTRIFRYRSTHATLDTHATALRDMIASIDAPCVHLVGHSLGGLVILRCLERFPIGPPGRVVFIGTPAQGSRSAHRIGQWGWWGQRLLGTMAQTLLPGPRRLWRSDRALGIIAGTSPTGLGRMLLTFDEDNDGTVAVSETWLPGAREVLRLPASHSGMLLSARVARETGSFLEYGSFGR